MKSYIVVLVVVLLFSAVVEHAWGDFVLTGNDHLNVTSSYNTGTLFDSSTADISAGGTVSTLYSNDTSSITICGGSVGILGSYNTSSVNVYTGSIDTLRPNDTSNVNIYGGNIGPVNIYDASNLS